MRIRGDRWLPKLSGSKIISPASSLPLDARVCELIDQEEHGWKSSLIEQEFLPHEASFIKGIPLSIQEILHTQVWLSSNHREYTTRTAYRLLVKAKKSQLPNCSTGRSHNQLWKGIWSLQVPYKVRHLIWRVAHEALLTLHNLLQMNVFQNADCSHCRASGEDTVHAQPIC